MRVIGDRTLHAKAVRVEADTDLPLLVALRSNAGQRFVTRLKPDDDFHLWSCGVVVLAPGDTSAAMSVNGIESRWDVLAFVQLDASGDPVMHGDGTGRDRRELAAAWLGCSVEDIDALVGP
ncbi:MAG: hypothetical protein EKK55_22645 [Rhodocyclaceae bacterium]|nr:MAG: hypothetical protein EKK55_22645 [Rhodocyclaceae bacterium]